MMHGKLAAGMTLVLAVLATKDAAAERPKFVREMMTIEGHRLARNKKTHQIEGRKQVVEVAVYRPADGLRHPAVVYLHGGSMNFADPVMMEFHAEMAGRGLVVLAPHYLLNGTGWHQWQESAEKTVSLAASLASVDPGHIGMSGLSMGGQIGLSVAARDPRIKAVAEYFTAWPGGLPDEPISDLPPVLLLNGTADPVIPFAKAMVLDEILKEHGCRSIATSIKGWATVSAPPPPSTTDLTGRPRFSAGTSESPGRPGLLSPSPPRAKARLRIRPSIRAKTTSPQPGRRDVVDA